MKTKPRVEFEKSAGAVVFHRNGEVEYLLILSTYWEFPKGIVEPGETESTAAIREIREETGLEVGLMPGFRREINYFYRRAGTLVKKQVVYFLALAKKKAAEVSWEHHEAVWLTFDQALDRLKYENARQTLAEANEFVQGL